MENKILTPSEYWETFASDCDRKALEEEFDRVLPLTAIKCLSGMM